MPSLENLRVRNKFSPSAGLLLAYAVACPASAAPCLAYGQQTTLHGKVEILSPCPWPEESGLHQKGCDQTMTPRLVLTPTSPICVNVDNSEVPHVIYEIELDYPGHNPSWANESDIPGVVPGKPAIVSGSVSHGGKGWVNDYVITVGSIEADTAHAQP